MLTTEPLPTAIALVIFAALLITSALFSRAGQRFGIPLALVFLGVGMLAGSEGLGGIAFEKEQARLFTDAARRCDNARL